MIEDVGEAGRRCGLNENQLKASVVNSIQPISITTTQNGPHVYVNVNTLIFDKGLCVSHISLEVKDWKGGELLLWQQGSMISSNQPDHARRVSNTVADLSKELVADWRLDNSH